LPVQTAKKDRQSLPFFGRKGNATPEPDWFGVVFTWFEGRLYFLTNTYTQISEDYPHRAGWRGVTRRDCHRPGAGSFTPNSDPMEFSAIFTRNSLIFPIES
jgi:hypothetical protein